MSNSRTPRKFSQKDLGAIIRLLPLLGAWKLVLLLIVVAAVVRYSRGLEKDPAGNAKPAAVETRADTEETEKPASKPVAPVNEGAAGEKESGDLGLSDLSDEQMRMPGMVIKDQEGKVLYRGMVDLKPTLVRIDQGKKLSYRNDGSVFENRERRIPEERLGHYREWVHPTKGFSGPGPQRVVTGKNREIYYTPDHYHSFRKIR